MKIQQILRTKDYDRFQVFKFNRPINESLVKKLMESIEEIGYMQAKPVLVDKTFAIIDGQHRFTACQRLGIDILYMMTDVEPEKAIIALNAQQINWKMIDYINFHAEQGVKCYQQLLEFESRRKLGITYSSAILFNGPDDGNHVHKIRKGVKFTINTNAEKIAQFAIDAPVAYNKTAFFIRVIIRVFKLATPEQLEKIKAGLISLPQQPNTISYMAAFENIVNKRIGSKNRVSFRIN